MKYNRDRFQPDGYLRRDYILTMITLESIGINLDYDLAKVPDHAAPPAIALDAGNSASSTSKFAFDRVP